VDSPFSISIVFRYFFNLNLPSGISQALEAAWFSIPLPLFYAIYFTIKVLLLGMPGAAGSSGLVRLCKVACKKNFRK